MIAEALQRSKNYEKLKNLMTTVSGLMQAESLYGMLRATFDNEEQRHMDIFFEPLHLAGERKKLKDKYHEAYANFKAKGDNSQNQDDTDYEALEQAFVQMDEAAFALQEKDKEWEDSLVKLKSHLDKHPSEAPNKFDEVVVDACWQIMVGTELR